MCRASIIRWQVGGNFSPEICTIFVQISAMVGWQNSGPCGFKAENPDIEILQIRLRHTMAQQAGISILRGSTNARNAIPAAVLGSRQVFELCRLVIHTLFIA
jgi:hypothetical protein